MKTKLFALMLALALALSLSACGGYTAQGGAPADGAPGTDAPGTSAPGDGSPGADAPEAPEGPAPQEDVDLAGFYDALLAETEWPSLMPLEGEVLDSFYPGLSDLSLKQCLVNTAAISAAVGEIALVEVEDAEDAKTVEEIFQARIDYQVGDEENPGGAWYPETIEGWRKNSRIVTQGTCVMMAAGDAADDAVERFNALFA
ncbi:DUF4358 domain-containing protein [uncultured Oscillibacter sp.]|uniref:DUF4358 domain-containing protein n=1 Tax=uncultured Oscillibacter sp. TaxID=876091 RepID=UPI0025E31F65|nr:DUF4358 domain-containing protein [uncultured Oscillibacter sp.]